MARWSYGSSTSRLRPTRATRPLAPNARRTRGRPARRRPSHPRRATGGPTQPRGAHTNTHVQHTPARTKLRQECRKARTRVPIDKDTSSGTHPHTHGRARTHTDAHTCTRTHTEENAPGPRTHAHTRTRAETFAEINALHTRLYASIYLCPHIPYDGESDTDKGPECVRVRYTFLVCERKRQLRALARAHVDPKASWSTPRNCPSPGVPLSTACVPFEYPSQSLYAAPRYPLATPQVPRHPSCLRRTGSIA
jgi:hypothetical protein